MARRSGARAFLGLAATLLASLGCGEKNERAGEDAPRGRGNLGGGSAGHTAGGAAGHGLNPRAGQGGEERAADDIGAGGAGGSHTACDGERPPDPILITDETNYTLGNSLTVDTFALKDASDLTFDWSGLTQDMFGQPLDAGADVDLVLLSLWEMSPGELVDHILHDTLTLRENRGVLTTYPEGAYTSRRLLEFDLLRSKVPEDLIWGYFDLEHPDFEYPPASHTFMVMASSGTIPGKGPRMLAFFKLDPESEQTELALTNDTASLDLAVSLTSAKRVQVPTGVPALTIDWSRMEHTPLGNEYRSDQITRAVVGQFSRPLEHLEEDFIALESLADGWWSREVVSGTSVDLGSLTDENGDLFPGITSGDVWLVALFCGSCLSPAPWSITVLEPCPEEG